MPSYHHVSNDVGFIFIIEPILKIGISAIDKDHQKLFDIINELNAKALSKSDQVDVDELFDKLLSYAVKHFKVEEAMFAEMNYQYAEEHKAFHDCLFNDIIALRKKKSSLETIMRFITAWINEHILKEDQKFVKPWLDHLAKKAHLEHPTGFEPVSPP